MHYYQEPVPSPPTRMSLFTLPRPLRRYALGVLLILFPALLWQSAVWTQHIASDRIRDNSADILALYTSRVRSELEKYASLSEILATHNDIIDLLTDPSDPSRREAISRYLERINTIAGASVIYVIDPTGTSLAASNWNQPRSFVGIVVDFRSYFQDAMQGRIGRFFGLGSTSLERGYYFAAPVKYQSTIVGVVAVKIGVDRFESAGPWENSTVVIADPHGVIFVASEPDWRLRTLHPLPAATLATLHASRQYGTETLLPLNSDRLHGYLVQSAAMPGIGWEVYLFSSTAPVRNAVLLALLLTLLLLTLAFQVWLYLMQRRAIIRARLAAQDQLEAQVQSRTAELQREMAERRQAENELIQASKLAALGQLSAGIVHEVNQPLAAIRAYADNALTFLDRARYTDVQSNLRLIGELTERIARITSHLKTFARKSPDRREAIALDRAVAYALSLLEPQLKRTQTTVIQDFPGAAVYVWGDQVRLEQVLVNLLKNALEAMPGQAEPQLQLSITLSDRHVCLSIRDTGPGIAEADLAQIFDPFFTTKAIGAGLGLGLSISNKIIREAGGTLHADNHPEGGAVFELRLLRADPGGQVAA